MLFHQWFSVTNFPFSVFLLDIFSIFLFVLWLWLFITIAGDLFSRHDISGVRKALWVVFLILLPFGGVLTYILFQGRHMAERNQERTKQARNELRHVVGFSIADELEKLERLKSAGTLTEEEYNRLRTKLIE